MSLLTSLESYWPMDDSGGSGLADIHGTNAFSPFGAGSATGKISTARDFEAASADFSALSWNASINTGNIDFTFSAWVQIESTGDRTILSKWHATTGQEFVLYLTGGLFDWYVSDGTGSLQHVAATNFGTPTAGSNWYFIVVWHDATNNQIGISVNNGTPNTASWSNGVFSGTNQFRIGNDQGANYWDGLIDEVGFWKRVLTAGERTQLYNGGAGLPYSSFGATAFTGTASLTVGPATLTGSATFTASAAHTATSVLTAGPATLAAAGTFTAPTRTATATLTAGHATLAGTAIFATAVRIASAALTTGPASLAGSATFAPGTRTATAALVLPHTLLVGSATVVNPSYTASAALTTAPATLTGTAIFSETGPVFGPIRIPSKAFYVPGFVDKGIPCGSH